MRSYYEGDLRTKVINQSVGLASEQNIKLDRLDAASIAAELYDRVTKRHEARAKSEGKLTNRIFKARLYCHIFFALVLYGWPKLIELSDGSRIIKASPISYDQRLGYPSRTKIYTAYKKIRDVCGKESIISYRQTYKGWKEARRRYLATETEASWGWYLRGEGNRNSVAYRTRVDQARKGGIEHFRTRRGFKYMAYELLSRQDEKQRAMAEMQVAEEEMLVLRQQIFDSMGVPKEYRPLV